MDGGRLMGMAQSDYHKLMEEMHRQQMMQKMQMMNQTFGGNYGSAGQTASSVNSSANQSTGPLPGASYYAALQAFHAAHAGSLPAANPKHDGISLGEIVAWRGWKLRGGLLSALTADLIWAPNDIVSGDIKQHGIHAFKTASNAATYAETWKQPVVVGRVALWGEVIEHEGGYRAEHAKPIGLDFVVNGSPDILAALRAAYGLEEKRAA